MGPCGKKFKCSVALIIHVKHCVTGPEILTRTTTKAGTKPGTGTKTRNMMGPGPRTGTGDDDQELDKDL